MPRRTLTRSPQLFVPGGYCVTRRPLKAAEMEYGPLPGQALGTQQIFPQILRSFLRDSGTPIFEAPERRRKICAKICALRTTNLRKNLRTKSAPKICAKICT